MNSYVYIIMSTLIYLRICIDTYYILEKYVLTQTHTYFVNISKIHIRYLNRY